ncbi:WYL domain-containing protein [Butyrivibrio sp. FC2001]|uniref:WYL domain-containing protein n=1 Tax=Butyrivibrio sp. FC2001 TaxID=1280671 RepID=UPI00041151A6|nr:WYL domain-containing protein [Butyrivibrio sp. FC2001]
MLIDAVSASKFLTEKKSKEIIGKIKLLGSKFDSEDLNRQIVLGKRIKTMNDKVLQNLDTIYSAISNNKAISFQYVKWNYQKKLVLLREGAKFNVSPFAITLSDDNYYLIAYDNSFSKEIRHYRIDKMQRISITTSDREGQEIFKSFDIVDYSTKSFSMFGGNDEIISLRVSNNLAGAIIDRFGENARIRPDFEDNNSFIARINVKVSDQFYAWLLGFGTQATILSPSNVKDDFVRYIEGVINLYK